MNFPVNPKIRIMANPEKLNLQNIVLAALLTVLYSCGQIQTEFYVSPAGDDENTGTEASPFLTLQKAKEAVADEIAGGTEKREIHIYFSEGVYNFDETVVLNDEEFAEGNNTIVISALNNEKVVFTSGKKLEGWSKLQENISGLPEIAQGKIWVTGIPSTFKNKNARFLYTGNGPLINAVSGDLYTNEENDPNANEETPLSAKQLSTFAFPDSAFRNWENIGDIEVIVRPHQAWVMNILPLDSLNFETGIATTTIPATYRMTKLSGSWYKYLPNLWIQNAIDYLDEPGEWVINSQEGRIYYWPPENEPQNVYYPLLQEIIRVEGDEKNSAVMKNIQFKGITFTGGDRDTWNRDDTGLQHDWAMYDKSDALLRFVDAENCVVDDCRFENSGGGGVRFDFYCRKNKIQNSEFSQLGGTSILFAGYGPGKKNVNRNNIIENNEIHNCGQIYWHSPAIFIWQSGGNQISHNLVYEMPYSGIVISGPRPQFFNTRMKGLRENTGTFNYNEIENFDVDSANWDRFEPYANRWDEMMKYLFASENIVEFNELHHNALRIDDGNGIYLSGTGLGNVVRNNYLHHNTSVCLHGIIRADDQAKDVTIINNVIYKFTNEGIKVKHPCVVQNNYIIDWEPSAWSNGRKYPKQSFINISPVGPVIEGTVVEKNICFEPEGDSEPFFTMTIYYPLGKLTKYSDVDVDFNLYYNADAPENGMNQLVQLRENGFDMNSRVADPLFEGFAESGFKLKPNSPALKMGIEQINIKNAGRIKNNETE